MRRRDAAFEAEGATPRRCRAAPSVGMARGISAVGERRLDRYAETLAATGRAAGSFDASADRRRATGERHGRSDDPRPARA
ncbi:MAG: hypothetical protein AVDCRST_MAG04-2842 [uncultured Acetobacteraceae bacterium]|uniref:Uncharacterized protein n=1 Tax=uncultured Acetobacteraceae bacterium TaxID=169975 RepID=A0A6J4J0V4_9PROT|nr:MAG: hypothetical protein AVDCRST_MAG04-2842 [uncultured Acetobacteraceae bacterium]